MFPHSCTFYRKVNDMWERYHVEGVLWQDTAGVNMIKSGLKDTNTLELYIPFSTGFKPLIGDFVIKGTIDYEIERKPSELFELYDVRTITTVDVFDFGELKHYEAGGK